MGIICWGQNNDSSKLSVGYFDLVHNEAIDMDTNRIKEGTYSQLLGIWALAIARATILPHSLCYEGAYINHVQGHMKRKRPLAPPTIQANPADVPDTTEHGEAIPTMPTWLLPHRIMKYNKKVYYSKY